MNRRIMQIVFRPAFWTAVALTSACLVLLPTGTANAWPRGGNGGGHGGGDAPAATVITLAATEGGVGAITNTFNNQTQAVGDLVDGSDHVPMSWVIDSDGGVTSTVLPSLVAGAQTQAVSLNNYGMIVGWEGWAPLFWASASVAAPLELPHPPGTGARAFGINDDGLIVGQVIDDAGTDMIAWQIGDVDGELGVVDFQILGVPGLFWAVIAAGAG